MYDVESIFKVQDKVSPALTKMIAKLEEAHKKWLAFEATLNGATATMTRLVAQSDLLGTAMSRANVEVSSMSRRLGNIDARGTAAASGMNRAESAMSAFNNVALQTNLELEQTALHLRDIRANSNINLRMRGGGMAGGEEGGGHRGGFSMGHVANRAMDAAFMGMIGMDIAKEAFKPAMEYQQQLIGLRSIGLPQRQETQIQQLAETLTKTVRGTTRAENLRTLRETYGLTRSFDATIKLGEDISKVQLAMKFLADRQPQLKGGQDFTPALIKATDLLGIQDPNARKAMFDDMFRSYEASGGKVTPLMLAKEIKSERTAAIGKEADFMGVRTYLLESMALGSSGGGSGGQGGPGVGIESLENILARGHINKRLMAILAKSGELDMKRANPLGTATTGTTIAPALTHIDEFLRNPEKWLVKYDLPILGRMASPGKQMTDEQARSVFKNLPHDQQMQLITQKWGAMNNRTAMNILTDFLTQSDQIDRTVAAIKRAQSVQETLNDAYRSSAGKLLQLNAEVNTFAGTLGIALAPAINKALDGLNNAMHWLNDAQTKFPALSTAIQKFNDQMFNTGGTFDRTGKALASINWKPLMDMIDKLAAHSIGAAGTGINMVGGIVGAGITETKNIAHGRWNKFWDDMPSWDELIPDDAVPKQFRSKAALPSTWDDLIPNLFVPPFLNAMSNGGGGTSAIGAGSSPVIVNNINIQGAIHDIEQHKKELEDAAHRGTQKALQQHSQRQARQTLGFINTTSKAQGNYHNPATHVGG